MQPALGATIVAGALGASAVVHVVRPDVFVPLIPAQLGRPRRWVYASALPEAVSAVGLLTRAPWAPAVSTATLAVIWVGNVQMAVDLQRSRRPAWQKAAAWARIPLQLPMMRAAWNAPVVQSES
jgi:uncharacterized membrane protein